MDYYSMDFETMLYRLEDLEKLYNEELKQLELQTVKPFFVCKFTFRLQPAMLPVVFVVRMLSPPALEHRSPVKQPHFVSILCFFASIAFHVNP